MRFTNPDSNYVPFWHASGMAPGTLLAWWHLAEVCKTGAGVEVGQNLNFVEELILGHADA